MIYVFALTAAKYTGIQPAITINHTSTCVHFTNSQPQPLQFPQWWCLRPISSVSIDGGMTDNLRPGLYGAKYHAVIANKMAEPSAKTYAISGKCCESTDILIHSVTLPEPETGDLLCVFSTGSYGYSMANNYNKIPIPAVVVIKEGKPELIIRRQTYMDLIQREI